MKTHIRLVYWVLFIPTFFAVSIACSTLVYIIVYKIVKIGLVDQAVSNIISLAVAILSSLVGALAASTLAPTPKKRAAKILSITIGTISILAITVVALNRSSYEGGDFTGPEKEAIAMYIGLAVGSVFYAISVKPPNQEEIERYKKTILPNPSILDQDHV